ncbi:lytic transglycosylase domain-containing protein [Pseudonocardia sp. HH130630-07]|uniref:lytic transglycosylase domain-containing protein n=1 Tax=Pseudonocardia sp. HH130630-07 TaxID=1690815 RepID=UPI0008150976|nr:lytic transglycosylase domain-containing protein [Pseudonocardia sp. HH130630-07]ANY05750.1 hypothetical protein AFB00_04880 [Pseudonocardia sp. HH130630-07]
MSARLVLGAAGTLLVVVVVFIGATVAAVSTAIPGSSTGISGEATTDIPAPMLDLYRRAASTCPGLDWSVLAAVGKVETDHGRSPLPGVASGENPAGAGGPMQFLAPTFAAVIAEFPPPPGGSTPPSRYDPHDAIYTAAAYLCDSGARAGPDEPGNIEKALWAYNHSDAYVADVLDQAHRYATTPPTAPAVGGQAATVPDPSGTGGLITPTLANLYAELDRAGALTGGVSCWDEHPQNPTSDHPLGKACDVFVSPSDPGEVTRGWQLAHWLTSNAARLGVTYVIWQGRIWSAEAPAWAVYESEIYGCPDPAEVTGCHYDHLHISTR